MQVLSHESISTVLRMSRDLERNQEATCYIGNLDERVTDEIVWELMLQAGPIAHVYYLLLELDAGPGLVANGT